MKLNEQIVNVCVLPGKNNTSNIVLLFYPNSECFGSMKHTRIKRNPKIETRDHELFSVTKSSIEYLLFISIEFYFRFKLHRVAKPTAVPGLF